ncbi:DUF3006 domain-containing protein [Fuchsiella alkaliacetigena]|uniref:DUF3006 domain-containing protein n=1 Tax=Fuchsiella alkaliacetigena TaxID=957042 RepID=UPI002009F08D|nr:DUF3006 domain-containing protein [Fuchsiella alkaliacetigena]MCK8825797.1 DUF3006 domain-containing protein [Fuchsiella alkaliacetigena]
MELELVVDRIEGDWAVLLIQPEENLSLDWPLAYLPPEVREGDLLSVNITKDELARKKREERVGDLIDRLTEDD